jgi:hypothetical protein
VLASLATAFPFGGGCIFAPNVKDNGGHLVPRRPLGGTMHESKSMKPSKYNGIYNIYL